MIDVSLTALLLIGSGTPQVPMKRKCECILGQTTQDQSGLQANKGLCLADAAGGLLVTFKIDGEDTNLFESLKGPS
jgi:hypothetical protein